MSPIWRAAHAAPTECPHGVVLDDSLRLTSTDGPGLGDYVAASLAAVGITKELVTRVTGKPCGCAKRQEALNALGRKIGIG
jgi:hypothetical protein